MTSASFPCRCFKSKRSGEANAKVMAGARMAIFCSCHHMLTSENYLSIMTPLSTFSNTSPEAKVLREKCSVDTPSLTDVESNPGAPADGQGGAGISTFNHFFVEPFVHNFNFRKAIDIDPRYLHVETHKSRPIKMFVGVPRLNLTFQVPSVVQPTSTNFSWHLRHLEVVRLAVV